jgi:hypothetical protein
MRKNIPLDKLSGLLTRARCAVLATNYADGTTLLSPVWFEWSDGAFTIVIFDGDAKAKHIKRDPCVSVVVAAERGNAYIDGFDPATQLTLPIAPGVLRTWDFADEAPLSIEGIPIHVDAA